MLCELSEREREKDRYFIIHDEENFHPLEQNQHIILYVIPSLEGGYSFVVKIVNVEIMNAHMCAPFLVKF